MFCWGPPTIPNGIITGYDFTVDRGRVTSANSPLSQIVCGLQSGQTVTALVRARTVIGFGPAANMSATTTISTGYWINILHKQLYAVHAVQHPHNYSFRLFSDTQVLLVW